MLIIYVRCTEDWHNYSCASLLSKVGKDLKTGFFLNRDLANKLVDKINYWDKLFSVKYFDYRAKLKSIATETYGDNKICYSFDELEDIVKDEDFICPCDDDDWFRPDIYKSITKHMNDVDFLQWDQIVHITHEFGPHRWSQYHSGISSNNYCVKGKSLMGIDRQDRMTLLHSHTKADEICNRSNWSTKQINNDLMSCYVWTIGSVSFMCDRDVSNFYKKIQEHTIVNEDMKWTQKYYDELIKIHNKLGKKEIKCL